MYNKANVRILNSLNTCLPDILEFTPTIDLITFFCILNILTFNPPPKQYPKP
jgi:hypothetical protein